MHKPSDVPTLLLNYYYYYYYYYFKHGEWAGNQLRMTSKGAQSQTPRPTGSQPNPPKTMA